MKKTFFIISLLTISLSTFSAKNNIDKGLDEINLMQTNDGSKVALEFINAYIKKSETVHGKGLNLWIKNHKSLSKNLKLSYEKLMKSDHDFDVILDAQDNPETFEIAKFDKKTNVVTVRGKEWKDFTLNIRLIEENGKWLIDGCGVVNMPKNIRAKR